MMWQGCRNPQQAQGHTKAASLDCKDYRRLSPSESGNKAVQPHTHLQSGRKDDGSVLAWGSIFMIFT